MTMSLSDLEARIPTPVSEMGRFDALTPAKTYPYDGTWLSHFVGQSGGDPRSYRQILRLNKIGAVITLDQRRDNEGELYRGRELTIPQIAPAIARHREYQEVY